MRDVILPNAIHDPNAMMIMLGHTDVADTTVLAPCRFQEIASPADLTRLEENVVIGIGVHLLAMVPGSDCR